MVVREGTGATSQVVAEAMGLSLPHAALAPSGQSIWLDAATRSARAMLRMDQMGMGTVDVLVDAAIRNAMVLHAAFGGSTNLVLHVPAIAHAAGCVGPRQPTGRQSIVRFHGSWTRFRMGRTTSRPFKYFLREECRK